MHAPHRPLSPHLQVYRFPLTVILSIAHRMTGALLALGQVALIAWLVAVAAGRPVYESAHAWFASVPGQVLLITWSLMLYFHLCNGIRHLFWDAGHGFELRTVDITAVITLIAAAALTALTWWLFLGAA